MAINAAASSATYGWEGTYSPAVSNLFFGPSSLASAIRGRNHSQSIGDHEGQMDATVKLVSAPIATVHAAALAFTSAIQLSFIFQESWAMTLLPLIPILGIPIVILGLGLCVVEGVYEIICICRSLALIYHTGSANDDREAVRQNLEYFERAYLPSQEELARFAHIADAAQRARAAAPAKLATLDRRVERWCTDEVVGTLRNSLNVLRSEAGEAEKAQATQAAKEALATMDTQAKKKLLVHIVGLAAVILCAASFIIAILTGPIGIAALFMTVGGVLATLNYLYAKGALNRPGWSFSLCEAIPPLGWIYDRFA